MNKATLPSKPPPDAARAAASGPRRRTLLAPAALLLALAAGCKAQDPYGSFPVTRHRKEVHAFLRSLSSGDAPGGGCCSGLSVSGPRTQSPTSDALRDVGTSLLLCQTAPPWILPAETAVDLALLPVTVPHDVAVYAQKRDREQRLEAFLEEHRGTAPPGKGGAPGKEEPRAP